MTITGLLLAMVTQVQPIPNLTPDQLQKALQSVAKNFPRKETSDGVIKGATSGPKSIILHIVPNSAALTTALIQNKTFVSQFNQGFCIEPTLGLMRAYGVYVRISLEPADQAPETFDITSVTCAEYLNSTIEDIKVTAVTPMDPPIKETNETNICSSYVGQTVSRISFDTAFLRFAKLTPKDEFETTAQYEARTTAVVGSFGNAGLVISVPIDRDYLEYDADKQEMQIGAYAFGVPGISPTEASMAAWSVIEDTGTDAELSENVLVASSSFSRITGSRAVQNGLGIKATLREIERTTKGIFDRPIPDEGRLPRKQSWIFPNAYASPHWVGSITISPTAARMLKTTMQLAFVVRPKAPYIAKGTFDEFARANKGLEEVTEKVSLLIADVQCGLALDAKESVLASYPTN